MRANIDFETRSLVDLRKSGVYPYAAHASTAVWCMAYAFGDEEPELWLAGQPFPARLADHVAEGGELRAWNASFERVIWSTLCRRRYSFSAAKREQFVCTAAEAAAMALPRSLDQCAEVLGVDAKKDADGYRIMMKMARPRTIHADGAIEWWDSPELVTRLGEYCKQDVRAERAIGRAVRQLSDYERRIFLLDQQINDRGILVDVSLARGAKQIVEVELERANRIVREATGGAVSSVTQRERMLAWLRQTGLEIDNLQKTTVQTMLEGEHADPVRQVLEARAEAGRTSVSKIDSLFECLCSDNRIRGMLLYHGASTGRWAGRLVQPHNFPRGEVADIERYIELVRAGDHAMLDLFGPPIVIVLSLLRGLFIARPGAQLHSADFSGIEARVTAWLAGQTDLVARFARNERVYEAMAALVYSRLWNRTVTIEEVTKAMRQLGKALVLGCGFGMGWEKFKATAALAPYFVTLTDEETQISVETYRERSTKIVQLWKDYNTAAIAAVQDPGTTQRVGAVRFAKRGAYLWIVLPSGRPLCYAQPRLRYEKAPWGADVLGVTFRGMNSVTRKWTFHRLYGGLITENVVQATARDIMADAMLRVEADGYPLILTVHDELVAEAEGKTQERFEQLVATPPAWAAGCPIAVEGWKGDRYHK